MKNSYDDSIIELIPINIIPTKKIFKLCLVNKDINKSETIQINIGDVEATSLYLNLNMDLFPSLTPDTHDLMIDSLQAFDIKISGILLTDVVDDIWQSEIELINTETGDKTYVEARSTDSIIIAIKLGLPINIYKSVIKKHKNIDEEPLNTSGVVKEVFKKENLKLLPLDRLEILMDSYVKKEDYESAQKIQDIIKNKRG